MSEAIIEFFKEFISNPFLLGIIISMVPLIELKGAIPAIYFMLGGQSALNMFYAFAASVIGTSLLAPLLLLIFNPLIAALKKTKLFGGLASWVERHFAKKSDKLEADAAAKADASSSELLNDEEAEKKKAKKIEAAKYLGLFLFTAIPLPLTGCWTASCVAAIMRLNYGKSLLYITLGNIVAGIAVALIVFLGGTLI